MLDTQLYEVYDGEVYYKGSSGDSLEEHIRKCAPCARVNREMPGFIVPHGQIINSEYKHLFETLGPNDPS